MKRPIRSYACEEKGEHTGHCDCPCDPETDSECLRLILAELRDLNRGNDRIASKQCDSLRAVADAARDFAGEMTYSLPEDDPSAAASWRALMDSLVKAGMWE